MIQHIKKRWNFATSDVSRLHSTVFQQSNEGIAITDCNNLVVTVNPSFSRLTGYPANELVGNHPNIVVSCKTDRHKYAEIGPALEKGDYWTGEIFVQHKNGDVFPVMLSITVVRSTISDPENYIVTLRDIGRHKLVEQALEESERHYRTLAEVAPVGIFHTEPDGDCLYVNNRWCEITGLSGKEALGKGWLEALHPEDAVRVGQEWYEAAITNSMFKSEYRFLQRNGTVKWVLGQAKAETDRSGNVVGYVGSITDISDHKAAEATISHLAHHDALTGLPNRLSFQIQLTQALAVAARDHTRLATLFIDLDRFKAINDALGHNAGDRLLVEVSSRLRRCVRASDIVARLGGDEFVVVLPSADNITAIAQVADNILHAFSSDFIIDNKTLHVTASIGIACFPDDGCESEVLMKNADTAMYHAKSLGRNNTQFFADQMNQVAMERIRWHQDLQQGLATGQFELYFQPQFRTVDRRLIGVEALLRWNHPREGFVAPDRFIHIAEESGLIVPLGEWVFDTACKQLRKWQDMGLTDLTMAINLSAEQLRCPNLLSFVQKTLNKYDLPGKIIEIEVTESVAMQDPQACIRKLADLRKLGIRLAIDDFGTGYSSLSYLRLLPIQCLKLDKSFLLNIESDNNNIAISTATIHLAHSLGLQVVGEGTETEAQYKFLLQNQCDILQGHFFSKPLPADEALDFINKRHTLPAVVTLIKTDLAATQEWTTPER
jgi:diguanylate cyclase (GGDEF)-like protein/PAS domain S-box-containing protein